MAFERLRSLFGGRDNSAAPTEKNVVEIVSPWNANRPLPASSDYQALCAEAYERNPVAWSCINILASSVAEPDLLCVRDTGVGEKEQLDNAHPLVRLLERPNAEQDQFEFLEHLLIFYHIAGEAYVHKVRARSGAVVSLRNLRPDRMLPVVSKYGDVIRYEYAIDGQKVADILPADVIAFRRLHPREDFRGLSQISIAARQLDLDNSGADYLRSLFSNGGIPRAFLKLKKKIDPKARRDLQDSLRDKYGSNRGWNDWSVLDEDADIQRFGLTPQESDLENIFANSETRTCAVFGVPPILVGVKAGLDRATYANYREAKRSFWDETLSPLFTRIEAKLTHGLAAEFGEGVRVTWDFSDVQALRENANEAHQRARDDYNAGIITLNEARTVLGLPLIDGGDARKSALDSMLDPVAFADTTTTAAARGARIDALIERAEAELGMREAA